MSTETDADAVVCSQCKLSAKSAGTIEHRPQVGLVCWSCERSLAMADKILGVLARAQSCRMNQRTIASKLGYRPSEINIGLSRLSRLGLIERAFAKNLERPSAVTYQLTKAGRVGTGVEGTHP